MYFSKKLTPAQMRYLMPEKEMLSLVEMFLKLKKVLLGHLVFVNTNALNLLYDNEQSSRINC